MPKIPFVAPQGIRWVRIDRASGRRVFGVFPVQEDPKSAVIWEAFQPQTEPRRFRRSHSLSVPGQPGADDEQDPDKVAQVQRRPRVVRARQVQQSQSQTAEAALQNQGAIY
jgi:penicillin-binding protein 1A